MQQVSKNVFVETEFSGCNVGFVETAEGIVMVDTPSFPSDSVKWGKAVRSRGMIKYLINTEVHIDHVFGNFFFPEATVVGHDGIRKRFPVTAEDFSRAVALTKQQDPEGLELIRDYVPRPPVKTYTGKLDLKVGAHSFLLINLPGHSPEQTAVLMPEERVVFTGDNVVNHNNLWIQEADPWEWLEALDKIADLEADVIVPGHGPVCDRNRVPQMASLIHEWVQAVQGAMDRGIGRDEAIQTISFLDRYPVQPAERARYTNTQKLNVANIWDRLVARRAT